MLGQLNAAIRISGVLRHKSSRIGRVTPVLNLHSRVLRIFYDRSYCKPGIAECLACGAGRIGLRRLKALNCAAEAGLANSVVIHEISRSKNGLMRRGFAQPASRAKSNEARS
jgi:hypothetical protein